MSEHSHVIPWISLLTLFSVLLTLYALRQAGAPVAQTLDPSITTETLPDSAYSQNDVVCRKDEISTYEDGKLICKPLWTPDPPPVCVEVNGNDLSPCTVKE